MARMIDIEDDREQDDDLVDNREDDNDDEDDDDLRDDRRRNDPDDDDEDDDDEPRSKRRKTAPSSVSNSDITRIVQQVQAAQAQAASSGSAADKRTASKLTAALENAIKEGFSPEQVKIVGGILQAAREDDAAARAAEKLSSKQEDAVDYTWDLVYAEIDSLSKKYGASRFARKGLAEEVEIVIRNSRSYQNVRDKLNAGRKPTREDVVGAVRKVFKNYLEENDSPKGKGKRSSNDLDVKSSSTKTKPVSAPSSNAGRSNPGEYEVDLSELSDMDRAIYTAAWNSTKNKKIAYDALRTVQRKQQRHR